MACQFKCGFEFTKSAGELPQVLLCKLKEGPEVRELTLRGLQMKEEVKLIEEELEWSDEEYDEDHSEVEFEDFDHFL